MKKKYSEFVFFSAGPVGDHALIIDWANRFFESTGKPSVILMKHPNRFLYDMSIPYQDHIRTIGFKGWGGKIKTLTFALTSLWNRRCYVLVLPIPPPRYLKVFAWYINYLTRSRMVALDSQCGFVVPGGPFSSAEFVGEGNYIPARVDSLLYYEQANEMLKFLGYNSVTRVPELQHVSTPEVLVRFGLDASYVALHLTASGPDRSLPTDRWNDIIKKCMDEIPEALFAFTGTEADLDFIKEATQGLDLSRIRFVIGVSMQELLTVYARAKICVTVHTGNAHLINMLHVPTVTVNFKGVHMFRFTYNPHGKELYSEIGCTCHPLERRCSLVSYKGGEYMACLFNTNNEAIVGATVDRYKLTA